MSVGAPERVGVVLLAAGLGRRMGGPNKLLADLGGAPVVRRSAQPLAAALPRAPRVAVTGRDGAAVAAALDGLDFVAVANPRFGEGMGTSLAAGVAALPTDLTGILVALGDMPGLAPASVAALWGAWVADPDPATAIARPVVDGTAGHPVLWGAAWRPALAALDGDRGGRDLLAAHRDRLVCVPLADGAAVRDIDCPADLAQARGNGWSWTGRTS